MGALLLVGIILLVVGIAVVSVIATIASVVFGTVMWLVLLPFRIIFWGLKLAVVAVAGVVGLGLFLALGIACWRVSGRLIRASRDRPNLVWAGNLARASQVSLVGFAVGGTFVNIAYWELPYYEIIILMAAHHLASGVAPELGQGTVEPRVLEASR